MGNWFRAKSPGADGVVGAVLPPGSGLESVGHLPIHEVVVTAVDVETTGLFDKDRVIEVGVIRATLGGEIIDEYETLVNPGRTVTDTSRIHGLSDRHLVDAPPFEEVAGDLARLLDGSVWVAHNAGFDKRFLANEYARLGADVSVFPALCTMQAARRYAGAALNGNAGLQGCCDYFGVQFDGVAHRAIVDARHALGILLRMVQLSGAERLADLGVGIGDEWALPLPAAPAGLHCTGRRICRDDLTTEVVPLPARGQGADRDGFAAYFETLSGALADRRLERHELAELAALAAAVGLAPAQAAEAHSLYFSQVADDAFADQHLSDAERRDLARVAEMLGIDSDLAERLIAEARVAAAGAALATTEDRTDLAGLSVCFSGTLISTLNGTPITRSDAQSLASRAGLVPVNGVTKKTDLLVVSDPHSVSAKTNKARAYGLRVVPEELFWREAGIAVD